MPRRVAIEHSHCCGCESSRTVTESSDTSLSSDSSSDDATTSDDSECLERCVYCGECCNNSDSSSESSSDSSSNSSSDDERAKIRFRAQIALENHITVSSGPSCCGRKANSIVMTTDLSHALQDLAAAVRSAGEDGAATSTLPLSDNGHLHGTEAAAIKSEQLNAAVRSHGSVLPGTPSATLTASPSNDTSSAAGSSNIQNEAGQVSTQSSPSREQHPTSLKRRAKTNLVSQHEKKKQKLQLESLKLALELGIITREEWLERGRRVVEQKARH